MEKIFPKMFSTSHLNAFSHKVKQRLDVRQQFFLSKNVQFWKKKCDAHSLGITVQLT